MGTELFVSFLGQAKNEKSVRLEDKEEDRGNKLQVTSNKFQAPKSKVQIPKNQNPKFKVSKSAALSNRK